MRAVILCLAVLAASAAAAQDYPAKNVRIIVPSAPGGGTLLGTQIAAAAPADGHTLLVGGLANMAFNLAMHREPRYNPITDFAPVSMVGAFTYALVARRDLPLTTFSQVVEFARANPGKLTIATSGPGTGQHVSALLLNRLAAIDLLVISYKGAQPAYVDVLAGRVDLFFDNTTTARSFIADGRVRPIVTSGSVRDALLPDVPTAAEAGLPTLVLDSWLGLFAPARTPQVVIERLRAATLKAVQTPEVRRRLETSGWRILTLPPEELRTFVKREAEKWPALLRQAGVKAE